MKKIIYFILLAFVGFACTDEAAIDGGGTGTTPTVPEGKSILKVTFSGTTSSTKSYATNLIGTAAENQVDSVKLFFFDGDASKKDTLVNVYTVAPSQASIGTSQNSATEATLMVTEKSDKMHIVAIANPADSIVLADWLPYIGIIDYDDFVKMTTLHTDSMPKPALLMTGVGKDKNTSSTDIKIQADTEVNVEFDLYRSVARIDILNRDSIILPETDAQKHKFILQTAKLINIPSQTYLYNTTGTNNAPTSARFLKNVNPETLDDSDGSVGQMYSQLYMYPTVSVAGDDDKEVKLYITGLYNGVSANYTIDFGDRDIKANNRYVVTLDSINPVTLTAHIQIVDWDTDTIKFSPEIPGVPTVEFDVTSFPSGVTFKSGVTGKPDTIVTKYINTDLELDFTVKSVAAEPTFTTAEAWISKKSETIVKSYADTAFIKKYTITVNPNTQVHDYRYGLIQFVNPAKPSEKAIICVKQEEGYTVDGIRSSFANPLAKFAHQNLAGVGSFVTGNDIAYINPSDYGKVASYGAWFQWGRNRAFTNTRQGHAQAGEEYVDKTINVANSLHTDSLHFFANSGIWYTEAGSTSDTWYNIAGIEVPKGSNNSTDPCPSGYRIPTANDQLAIMPGVTIQYTSTDLMVKSSLRESTATGYTLQTGPAYYVSGSITGSGSNTIKTGYGIKNNGTDSAYVMRWRHIGSNTSVNSIDADESLADTYLEITSIKVGNGFIATEEINKEDFDAIPWQTTAVAAKREVRYFPAAGIRRYSGLEDIRGFQGFYWSSSAGSFNSGRYMCLINSEIRLGAFYRGYGFSIRCVKN